MTEGQLTERRAGGDRRGQPERRLGSERRYEDDRRIAMGSMPLLSGPLRPFVFRALTDRRSGDERRVTAGATIDVDRRSGEDRRSWETWTDENRGLAVDRETALSRATAALMDLLCCFYDANTDGGLWSECLEGLCGAFGSDVCALGWHDYGSGLGGLEHSVNIGAEYVSSFGSRYSREDVWLRREDIFRGGDDVICGDEVVSEEEVLGSTSYQDWYRPQDLFYVLYGVLDRRGGRVLYVMFGRSRHRGRFGEDEVGVLRRLLPKLQRGYRAGERYRRVEGLRRAASDALDAFPMGVVFVGAGGDVVAANRVAREVLDSGEGLVVGDGILWVDWGWRRVRVRDLVLRVTGRGGRVNGLGSEGPAFTVPRSSGQRPLSVLIAPLEGASATAGADQAVAVLYIGDPERAPEIDRERLSQLYGLSRAEARVVALLAQGHRLEQVATELGVAYDTVRKHLKQVFSKTSSDRQAELIRILLGGPPVLQISKRS